VNKPGHSAKPSLLAVTSELPWPLNSGGHLRTYHLLRTLAQRFRVRLVVTLRADEEAGRDELAAQGIETRGVSVGRHAIWRESLRACGAAVCSEPYVLYRRHNRRPIHAAIREAFRCETPQVVYLDHLDSMSFTPLPVPVPFVVDLHNVCSKLVRRVAEEPHSWIVRQYLRREARLLAKMERRTAEMADALLAVSEEEARHFEALGARTVSVVPNGVDCARYGDLPLERSAQRPTILFLGGMAWAPNVGCAVFLAREVLPRIRKTHPEVRLQIVGRDPPASVRALNELPAVEVTGEVPDVTPYWRAAHVLAVPLDSGGGTRLKVLEAFAAGVPVVSTPIGCEGIDAFHGQHLLIAPREEFAEAVRSILDDRARGIRLARAARELAWQRYDWGVATRPAFETIEAILAQRAQREA
jgi:glycosyltransferase involved in cell wall biosynthesis